MILKRIDAMSCGKVLGALYALMGLVLGAIMSLISILGAVVSTAGTTQGPNAVASMLFGVGAIVLLPVFYGVMGFIGGIIGAALYNFVSSFVGGIQVELSQN